jgi:N-acetylglucosaminyl-diphospho-decaprenol L-rhamnosyltransferase
VTEVAAVVVSFNVRDLLLRCIASLKADGVDRIVVVDNASRDTSADAVADHEPDVTLLRLDTNIGFGAGVNRGVARTDARFVLIVNPDVIVEPGSTKALVEALERDPTLGVVGPLIETSGGEVYPSARSFPNLVDAAGHAFLHFLWPRNPFSRRYRMLDWDRSEARDVDWVAGTHVLVRREAWDAVGGFDEAYFMYMEDVDLCWRLRRAGWRTGWDPASRCMHEIGRSTDQTPYRMILAHHRAMLKFAWRSGSVAQKALTPLMAVALTVRTILAWIQRAVRGRPHAAK